MAVQHMDIKALFQATPINGVGNAVQQSGIIDMRRYARAESLWFRVRRTGGASSTEGFAIFWRGAPLEVGPFDNTPFGLEDGTLVDTTASPVVPEHLTGQSFALWNAVDLPDFKCPFLKLDIQTEGTGEADLVVDMYIYLRTDFAT